MFRFAPSLTLLSCLSIASLAACGSSDESATTPGADRGRDGTKGGSGGNKGGSSGAAGGGSSVLGGNGGGGSIAGGGASAGGNVAGGGASAGGSAGSGFSTEICDGLDNDGDGEVDESCPCNAGQKEACFPGLANQLAGNSSCKAGTHTCIASGEFGAWGPCEGAVKPVKETCNGKDDDCNGIVDDGCECVPGAEVACGNAKAPCKQGKKICDANGAFGPCVGEVGPTKELCDGVDNDCDGIVDNGGSCECIPGATEKCGTDVGECSFGAKICDPMGKFGPCIGGNPPEPELCDKVDNNCDGQIDEIGAGGKPCQCTPGTTQPCGKAVGECKAGLQVCQQDGSWGECVGGVPGKTEVCNGKDDDCDGIIDSPACQCVNGDSKACPGEAKGQCLPGATICKDGKWGPCEGVVGPAPEVCGDKTDNDCNGAADEGCETIVKVDLKVNGDCVCSPSCPPNAPYPVGCSINFDGGNSNGCVATAGSRIYFQEGVNCGEGSLSGTLTCSSKQGGGLNAGNCPINKSKPKYGSKPSDCEKAAGKHDACFY